MTAIVDLDPSTAETLHAALGPDSIVLPSLDALRRHLETQFGEDAVVLGPDRRPRLRARRSPSRCG